MIEKTTLKIFPECVQKNEFCSGADLITRPEPTRPDSPDVFTRPVRKSAWDYRGVPIEPVLALLQQIFYSKMAIFFKKMIFLICW